MARTRDQPGDEDYEDEDYMDGDGDELEEDIDGFVVDEPLNEPETVIVTTKLLHSLVHQGVIDLDAPYQREVVWNDRKQSHLINSIFRNMWIPPIVLALKVEDGNEVRVCVDGKQRLTSIVKFFDGQIPYRDKSNRAWWFTVPPSKKKGLEIPKRWKDMFSNKKVTCAQYSNLSLDMEREIFQRVQMGVVLRESEKMQSIASPRVDFIRELQGQFVDTPDGLADSIPWRVNRANDFQCLAQIAFCIGNLPAQAHYSVPALSAWLREQEKPSGGFKSQVRNALTEMFHLATTPELDAVFTSITQRVAPVEFVFLAILLYRMADDFTHEERAEAALEMRQRLRRDHVEIFAKTSTFKTLWSYIDSIAGSLDDDSSAAWAPSQAKKRQRGAAQGPAGPSTKKPRPRKSTGGGKS